MTVDRFMTGLMVVSFLGAVFSVTVGFVDGIAWWAWVLDIFTFVGLLAYVAASLHMRRH